MRLAKNLLLTSFLGPACTSGATDPGGLSAGPPIQLDTGIELSSSGTGSTSTGGSTSTTSGTGTGTGGASTSTGAVGDSEPVGASSSTGTWMADLGQTPDFGIPYLGCQGKIDFMFVITSNWDAKLAEPQLKEMYPKFVQLLSSGVLKDYDYQVMVVDAAGRPGLEDQCWECYQCKQYGCDGPGCSDWGGPPDYPCQTYFGKCDGTDGAGVTLNGNWDASNKRCELFGGNRYIIKGEPKLLDNFLCIADVGAGPRTDVAAQSMMKAFEPKMLKPGGCNGGFVRPDALLVVIVIQGDLDLLSWKTPEIWYQTLLDAKGGDPDAVLVMAMSTDRDTLPAVCPGAKLPSNPWRKVTEIAAHGLFASMCEPSYVPFLEQGAAMAVEMCSKIVPP